jgi:hypothetical protein
MIKTTITARDVDDMTRKLNEEATKWEALRPHLDNAEQKAEDRKAGVGKNASR